MLNKSKRRNEPGTARNGVRGLAWASAAHCRLADGRLRAAKSELSADRKAPPIVAAYGCSRAPALFSCLLLQKVGNTAAAFRDGDDIMLIHFVLCSFIQLLIPSMISTVLAVNLSDASVGISTEYHQKFVFAVPSRGASYISSGR